MPHTLLTSRPMLPAAAIALSVLASASHAAVPVDAVVALLDGPEFGGLVSYGEVVETGDGGVEIHDLRLTPPALRAMGLIGSLDEWEGAPDLAEPKPTVISIDLLHLNVGTLAMLFGVPAFGEPEVIAFGMDGLRIDLASVSDVRGVAMLQQYLGGATTLAGWVSLEIRIEVPDRYEIAATLDLAGIGRVAVDLGFEESEGLPRGDVTFTDTAGRGIAGLMAYVQRCPVEMTLELANATLQNIRDHPSGNPDAEDPIIAVIKAEAAAATALLARFPEDGPAAAAAMAAWAEEMATALPGHAALFEAIGRFAVTSGTLRLNFAPTEGAEVPMGAAFELPFYSDTALFAATIEALGLGAEFEAAR